MPGSRFPVAERFIFHHVHFAEHLDPYIVSVAMIGSDIVADDMAQWSPNKRDIIFGQDLTSALQFTPVFHLKGNVMQRWGFVAHKVHGVVVNAAAHEDEMVTYPVRSAKA